MSENLPQHGMEVPGERGAIAACLAGVRRRLWLMRIVERAAVGLAWGAGVAVFMTAAWLLHARWPWAAAAMALLPALGAAFLWKYAATRRTADVVLSRPLLLTGAVLTLITVAAMIALVSSAAFPALPTWSISAMTAGIFVLAAALSVRPVGDRAAAIFVDQQVGLRERVSTALELLRSPAVTPLEEAFFKPVVDSAVSACQDVRHSRVNYGRVDRRVYAAAALTALAAAGVSLLQPLPALARPTPRQFQLVVEHGAKLSEAIKQLEEKKPLDPVTAGKLEPLKTAISELKKGNMSPFEEGAKLSEIKKEMQKDLDAQAAADKAQKELAALKGMEDFAKAGDQLKDAASKAAGDAAAEGQKAESQKGLQNAADALGQSVGGMSDSDKKNLADGIKGAAEKASGDDQLQKNLSDAADAASKGDGQRLADSLKAAGQRMAEQRSAGQLSSDTVHRAMDEISRMERNGGGNSGDQGPQSGDSSQGGGAGDQQAGGGAGDQSGQQGGGRGGSQGQGGAQAAANNSGAQGQTGDGGQGGGNSSGRGPDSGSGNGGSTNFYNPSGPGDHQVGGAIGKEGTFVRLYDPKEIASQGKDERLSTHLDPKAGPAAGKAEVLGPADDSKTTIDTYQSQFNGARQRAMDDLSTQSIPPQYQELIKAYYGK